jgi:o-succinylbenzoate---CoA ligase
MGAHSMSPIDFRSAENAVLLNPRMDPPTAQQYRDRLAVADTLTAHVFLLTSGTNTSARWVALSKEAILSSAEASNSVLESDHHDVWLHALPDFHVSGIGIWARSYLSGATVVKATSPKWSPQAFLDESLSSRATLASLVPTQIHDIVETGRTCPPTFRAILVGGGALPDPTWNAAKALGWPILRTYGMTETASQVATESLNGPEGLQILPHLEARTDEEGRIQVRGASLLTAYITEGPNLTDPKDAQGWFTTEDLGIVDGKTLIWQGRKQDRIKIGGELANLAALIRRFDQIAKDTQLPIDYALLAAPDDRLESVIVLFIAGKEELAAPAISEFNRNAVPYERIRKVHVVDQIPRTDLGKVKRAELLALGST